MNDFHPRLLAFQHGKPAGFPCSLKSEKPMKLIQELKELSESIINNCKNDQLEKASEKMTLLNQKLGGIDDKTVLDFGTGTLREIVLALQVVQSANRIAVSKGLAAIVINNPFFNT